MQGVSSTALNFVVAAAAAASAKAANRGNVIRRVSSQSAMTAKRKNNVRGTSVVTSDECAVRLGSRKQRNAASSPTRGPSRRLPQR